MAFLTHNDLHVTHHTIVLPRLPQAFEGIRLVQLSDLHFYEYTDSTYYDAVVDRVNDLRAHVVVVTGDIVHFGQKYLPQASEFLKRIQATEGKFGIIGNHDFHDGAESQNVGNMLEENGYKFLRNANAILEKTGKKLYFVGLDDLWYGNPNIEEGLQSVPKGQATIMLAHNPLMFDPIAYAFSNRVDLVLSGHTHAGHVYIPVLGPIYRKIFRMKYRYGLYEKNGCQMHVTSGVGSAAFYLKKRKIGFPRFRFNTHPEIAVLTLTRGH